MQITLQLFIVVLALVSLLLATAKVPELPRVSWGWLGLFLWLLSSLMK